MNQVSKQELRALLDEVGVAYEASLIKQRHPEWYYSLITGSLEKGQPLIVGFNWGVSDGHQQQNPEEFNKPKALDKKELGSMARALSLCEEHIGKENMAKASQTNFCFFRSKLERQIHQEDIALCKPIFEKLLASLEPQMMLCFSSRLRRYLIEEARLVTQCETKELTFPRGKRNVSFLVVHGYLNNIKIGFLPHPNYPMPSDKRKEAWEFVSAG